MTTVDEIKNRIDILDLVSDSVKLRRSGKNYLGFCPFHDNKRTPAFVVFPDSGTWRCFGQCNEGGDIFKYVMKKEGWDFAETLRYLAEKAGVELQPQTEEQKEQDEQYDHYRQLLEEAVTFYQHQLLQAPEGKYALNYLLQRGVTRETIETFGLGFAPASWDITHQYFFGKGYSELDLIESGLVTQREGGGVYDRFRNRLMFAIRDMGGRMSGFGARILDPDDVPKYLNSPQTPLFDKGRLLYGLNLARKAIRAEDQVVIVEGYMDVIVPYQAGFLNTVSPMGTALTEDQMRLLKRFTRRIVLALDADAAGEKATLRGLEVARQALDHSEEISFNPRGLLRYEARLEADVRVTTIPEGMDPDEIVLRDPEEWRKIVESAKPIVLHVMETLAGQKDLDDPKVKREISTRVLPLIEDIPNAVERDAYRQRLARLLKVDERALVGDGSSTRTTSTVRRRPKEQQAVEVEAIPVTKTNELLSRSLEKHCLRLLLQDPEWLHVLDRALQKNGLNRMDVTDFEYVDFQILARLIMQSLEQDRQEPQAYLTEHIPEELTSLVDELQNDPRLENKNAQKLQEDLIRTLMKLRLVRVNDGIQQMRFLMEEMQEAGETGINPYQDNMLHYTLMRSRLDLALGRLIQLD
ncbi:MAG: DNA primase [Chloroflexi bacterium HGW-Chloroflexi-2]|jgi:DNA primase|nr:MAG: DNA primase [Chloroflexi bacterium HGW-Chloroflexi-2]